jgi:hypothetical protein
MLGAADLEARVVRELVDTGMSTARGLVHNLGVPFDLVLLSLSRLESDGAVKVARASGDLEVQLTTEGAARADAAGYLRPGRRG